jgi:hypothetical protein
MHPIFKVTPEDIRNLDDIQARELVSRLCRAELRAKGVSEAFVTWGGDQRAKDGGVDVRVDIDLPVGMGGYIAKDATAFQVKAEQFGKAKISIEMAPNGKLRPAIIELASNKGAYIIVSTKDSLSDSSLTERKNAMSDCLSAHGLAGKVVLDFYDSRKIADWGEQYPAIVTWLKHTLGKPIVGWQPYAPWAYREDNIEAEYLLDDRIKIFAPNFDEGIAVSTAIDRLRSDLSNKISVRIVGLSGVGKTRLVQALFDNRISTEHSVLDRENVIYTDLSDDPTPQPSAMIEALMSEGSNSVVVIDNCGPDVHQKMTELIKSPNSRLRLVTIEYDIRDDLPEDTVCYRLEGSSDSVIKELLNRRYPVLSDSDIYKITDFSDGNARVAFALASSSETKGELARLEDADLFRRLFLQKNEANNELLRCAEVASFLYSFDAEDLSTGSELAILASLAEVSILTFSLNVGELQRRGLVQARGKWRAVLPHAISNRLALLAIESYPKETLIAKFIDSASPRVARSFSRRLGYLHESKRAREIVEGWLSSGGRFGDLTKLNKIGRQIFSNIAPVDQKAALEALLRETENQEFLSTDNHDCSDFARIARALAYEPSLFDQAVVVLTRFALAEPEGFKNNPIRNMVKSLFFCHLSGTESPPKQRAMLVKRLLISGDNGEQKLGIILLDAALKTSHFSSDYGFDFGARKRGYGWWPRTHDDMRDWYQSFIDIAVEVGKNSSEIGRDSRVALGASLRGLWKYAGLVDELTIAARELAVVDGWPEGWVGLRSTLHWHEKILSEYSLSALRKLEKELAPRDLNANIRAKVLARGSFIFDLDENDEAEPISSRFQQARDEAEKLGKAAAMDEVLLSILLPDLLRKDSNGKIGSFGFGVGQSACDPIKELNEARTFVGRVGQSSTSLVFIRGLISGWYKVKPDEVSVFLDSAVSDDVWGTCFPELQMCVDLDDIAHSRLMKALALGKAPSWQFNYLGGGRATDPFSVKQISLLIDSIAAMPDNGLTVAVEALQMVIFFSKEKVEEYQYELAAYCIRFLQEFEWSAFDHNNENLSYYLNEIIEFALASVNIDNEISIILSSLIEFERSDSHAFTYREGRLLEPFFKYHPKQTLNAVYIPDSDGHYTTALHMLSDWGLEGRDPVTKVIPAEVFVDWCEISPKDRYLFAAHTCKLFDRLAHEGQETKDRLVLSDIAKRVFDQAHDKQSVLEIFIDRFQPSVWSGSLAAILRDRLPLLDELDPGGNKELEDVVAKAKNALARNIELEENREETKERNLTSSFE